MMPCHPAKARLLIKRGKALPKRNKLGIFYVQLTYEKEVPASGGVDAPPEGALSLPGASV